MTQTAFSRLTYFRSISPQYFNVIFFVKCVQFSVGGGFVWPHSLQCSKLSSRAARKDVISNSLHARLAGVKSVMRGATNNRTKLENIFHRVFGTAQLDIEIKDRFGKPVIPREWPSCRSLSWTRRSSGLRTERLRSTFMIRNPRLVNRC